MADGTVYSGEMINSEGILIRHGKGTQSWFNGGEYDGDWHEDKM